MTDADIIILQTMAIFWSPIPLLFILFGMYNCMKKAVPDDNRLVQSKNGLSQP